MTTETHSPTGSLTNEEYVARLNKCLDAGVQIVYRWREENATIWWPIDPHVRLKDDNYFTYDFLALLPGTSFDEWKANGFPIDDCIPEWLGS